MIYSFLSRFSSKSRMTARSLNSNTAKYKHIWQSIRIKLRFRFLVNKIIKVAINDREELRQNNLVDENTPNDERSLTDHRACILLPESKFIEYWNIFIGLTVIYSAVFMPYYLAFPPTDPESLDLFDKVFSGIYFIDFIFNCNLAYRNHKGTLVLSRAKIFLSYLKKWMIIDLIAFFPFDYLITDDSNSNHLTKLVRVPRLYKVLKISKALKWIKISKNTNFIMKIQDIISIRHSVIQIIITFFTITTFIHVAACIWCFVGFSQNGSPDSWLTNSNLDNDLDSTFYLTSFYWAFTTFATVGYGDITAYSNLEKVFCMLWMLCSLQFLGITIASLTNFLGKIETRDKSLINKLAIIDEFAIETGLKKSLRLEMRKALRQSSIISGFTFNEKIDLVYELPKNLRYDVALAMHRGAAKVITFFRNKDDSAIIAIVPFLRPMYCKTGDFVYEFGKIPEEFYFIMQGKVLYINVLERIPIYMTKKKDYFGDIELLLQVNRKFHAVCNEKCEFLVFSSLLLSRIKKVHPIVWNELKNVAEERNYVLDRSLIRLAWLRDVCKEQPKSEADIEQFKTYQKIKRDMKNAFLKSCKKNKNDISERDVSQKLDELNLKLNKLQNDFSKTNRARRY